METNNVIGNNIRKFRKEKNWSQPDLAKALGYSSKSSISKLENGREIPRPAKVKKFADILGVSVNDIMGWTQSNFGVYTTLIRAYEDASEKERKAVCAVLDIPLIEVATPD